VLKIRPANLRLLDYEQLRRNSAIADFVIVSKDSLVLSGLSW
jgi:hypothetical protein